MGSNLPTAVTRIVGNSSQVLHASIYPVRGPLHWVEPRLVSFLPLSCTSFREPIDPECGWEKTGACLISSQRVANSRNGAETVRRLAYTHLIGRTLGLSRNRQTIALSWRAYTSYSQVYCQQGLSVVFVHCPVRERSPFPTIFGHQCDKLATSQSDSSNSNGALPATSLPIISNFQGTQAELPISIFLK